MDFIQNNIKFLRKQRGATQESFSKELGIKRSLLGAYEEGRAKPSYDTLIKIANIFSITVDRLIKEDLNKTSRRQLSTTGPGEGDGLRVLAITVDKAGKENIELVPEKAAAGYLAGYADPTYIEELPKFNLPFLTQGTYRAFEIIGDSMLPLQPGSIVVGEYVEQFRDLKDGQTYIIVSQNEGIVYKRVFNQIKENNALMLRSDNPAYPPYSIPLEEVIEVWKATLHISHINKDKEVSMEKLMAMMQSMQSELTKLKSGS